MDIEAIQQNWLESQNEYSSSNRKCASHHIKYHYYKKHQGYTYTIGRYRYSINGDISVKTIDKDLKKDGIDGDKQAYYWHYFHNSCSFVKDLDFSNRPDLIKSRFMVKRINEGEWNFNHNAYACVVRFLAELKSHIKPSQSLVVYLPTNKQIQKKGQDKYFTEFINLLRNEHITYVVGNIDKINELSKQLVVFVIDIITNANRQNTIVQNIRNKRASQFPLISYYSLFKILDENSSKFSIELFQIRKQQEKEKKLERESTSIVNSYDEEELLMRALSGRGPDPEIFGF